MVYACLALRDIAEHSFEVIVLIYILDCHWREPPSSVVIHPHQHLMSRFSHSDCCSAASLWSFYIVFAWSYMFIHHFDILFCEVPIQIFSYFLIGESTFFLFVVFVCFGCEFSITYLLSFYSLPFYSLNCVFWWREVLNFNKFPFINLFLTGQCFFCPV